MIRAADRVTNTTLRGPTVDGLRREPFWHLTVLHHERDPSFVGAHFALGPGMQCVLGRDCDVLSPAVFADRRTSRRHCVLSVGPTSVLTLEDCGSTNGTKVNGRRAGVVELADGDLLALPGVLLCAANVASVFVPGGDSPLVARSALTAALRDSIAALPELEALVLYGEPGSGADAVRLAWSQRAEASSSDAWSFEDPPPLTDSEAPRLILGKAVARTIVEAGSFAARSRALARLEALREGGARVLVWVPVPRLAMDRATEAIALARSLGVPALRLPPLRRRAEDLPALLAHAQRSAHGHVAPVSGALASAIVRASFLGNLPALARFARAKLAPAPDGSPIELDEAREAALLGDPDRDPSLADDAPRSSPTPSDAAMAAVVRVRRDGRWFCPRDGEAVDLVRRPLLARLVGSLLDGLARGDDAPLSADALIEQLWPGARFVGDSGTNRLYVAIATLRKLGMRDALVRDERGYRLDRARVELVDE